MSDEAYLKEDLIALRKELGLTQLEMANGLGMALRSYQAIESGESEYRYIHRLAAERVALMMAVDKNAPMIAPASVRKDAVELVRLGEHLGHPAFTHDKKSPASTTSASDENAEFRAAYGIVGELVLLTNALDHQLNHVLINVLHLKDSPMLESVVATLDTTRKIEMLKERTKHINRSDLKKHIVSYLGKLERVLKWRNVACHTVLIPDDKHGAVFAPIAAAKLLKHLQVGEHPTMKRIPVSELKPQIKLGESALVDGQEIVGNFQRMNAERQKRYS